MPTTVMIAFMLLYATNFEELHVFVDSPRIQTYYYRGLDEMLGEWVSEWVSERESERV